jgi:hypothetical protein
MGTKGHRHYFVATQDKESRSAINRMPGVPTLYLSQVVLIMEAPSDASKTYTRQAESHKVELTEAETKALQIVNKSQAKETPAEAVTAPAPRIKRKATAANPLSCQVPREVCICVLFMTYFQHYGLFRLCRIRTKQRN